MRRPWTDEQLARARKMLAAGVPKQQIDRYFGRARNSIFQALARRDDPARRAIMAQAYKDWRAARSAELRSARREEA